MPEYDLSEEDFDKLTSLILSQTTPKGIQALISENRYLKYQDDPVGFCEEILHEILTDDIKILMESVRDNPITIAVSANGTGKTHGAARVVVWFYLCFPDTKVFTAAAPPYDNLKNLLWGEIGSIVRDHPGLFIGHEVTAMDIRRGPEDYLIGVTIPSAGTEQEKEAKFCVDADELFDLSSGERVSYKSLIGKTIDVTSMSDDFKKESARAEFFDNGLQSVYKITLSNGMEVVRTGQHPFYTGSIRQSFKQHNGKHVKGRSLVLDEVWVKTEDLKPGDAILVPEDTSFNFGNLIMDCNEIKVLAYLIGDGYIGGKSGIQFFQEENKQLSEFRDTILALGSTVSRYNPKMYSIGVRGNPVKNLLMEHGVYGHKSATKHIPEKIFQLNKACIALFLNRLYSTDGWACTPRCGKYKKSEIGYVSKSERLVRDVQQLLFRFGISSTVREQKKKWIHKGIEKHGYYWICTITRASDVIEFVQQIDIYGKENATRGCVQHSANVAFKQATWRNSWHKGFLWEKVKSIETVSERPTVGVHVPGNNTYFTNLVEHNSGKHQKHMLFGFDEGDAIPGSVYKGTESCMSGGHSRLLIMFNPRHAAGPVYRMIKGTTDSTGKIIKTANVVHLSAFRHPNVVTGEDVIPGAVSREATVRRINEWTRPLRKGDKVSERSVYTLPDFLVGAVGYSQGGKAYPPLVAGQYKIINSSFSYMVLGRYPAQASNQLISEEWIALARSRYEIYVAKNGDCPPVGAKGVMGLDVAEMGDDSNVAVGRYGGYLTPFDTWGGIDTVETGDRAIKWYNGHPGIDRANVDGNGYGAGVAPHMQKFGNGVVATGIKVTWKPTIKTEFGDFKILRDELLWRVREWLRTDSGAMLPPDEDLLEELMVPTYETFTGYVEIMKTEKMKEYLGRSPDHLMSLALTFAGAGGFFDGCNFQAFPEG